MKWLCGIFGPGTAQRSSSEPPHKEIRRWNFIKSFRKKDFSYEAATAVVATSLNCTNNYTESSMYVNPDEHAIAVAVATAAATEAAVVAAEAAAAVVRLTCRSSWCTCESLDIGNTGGLNTETAAVIIQSAYRGLLARRALRALKALIKVQAIVRGHIERKRAAEWLRRMQALMRAQLRAKTGRIRITPSSQSTHPHHARNGSNLSERTPDNHVYVARTKYSKAMMRSLSAPKAKVSHLETSH